MLPAEVEQMAANVSAEKRSEVQSVLNSVFNGVSKMRDQLDNITVVDEFDKTNMKLANTIRLGVRQVRLDAEKTFDAKRAEVQQAMLSFKTEDALWLKAKQTMQILTKEIEETAKWKETTKERIEAERKELEVQTRISKISKFAPEIDRSAFENMTAEVFDVFLAGIEKAYNDKIEAAAKEEAERIAKQKAEEEERERIRVENQRLKDEAEAREKKIAEEKAAADEERKAIEAAARKEREEAERKIKEEQQKAKEAADKAAAEQKRLHDEIKAKEDAERKAKEEAEARAKKEEAERLAAEKKAQNAPDREKLLKLANDIEVIQLPNLSSAEAARILDDIKILLGKTTAFIREKCNSI